MVMPDATTGPVASAAVVAGGFVAGCLVGSFLNVVAHRVPRRETVIFGRSHCPACGAMIRPRDNVPVLGWIALGGRCRDCGASISSRYPLVEAACGSLVAVVTAAELAGGDRPGVAATAAAGRATLALTLVAWALLAGRGHLVSGLTVGSASFAALLAAACVPGLAPLPVGGARETAAAAGWPPRVLASLVGCGAGWLAGLPGGLPPGSACGLVGAALGWQAALAAAVAAGLARAAWRQAAAAPLAAVLTVVCWHPVTWAWQAVCRAVAAG
ncbi:MAG: prepilin peptidase [Planctomycetaceae bacterium]